MVPEKRYYSEFDLLRILISVSISFIYHYGIVYKEYPLRDLCVLDALYEFAFYGVELFFMISGFVMYMGYYDVVREGRISFGPFMINRIKRIYPLMILTVLAAAVGELCWDQPVVAKPGSSRTTLKAVILNLFGVQSGWVGDHVDYSVNGPTWFISILMICYIFFFLILKGCSKNKMSENIIFALMIFLGIFLYDNAPGWPLLYGACGRGYVCFFSGILIAKLERDISFKNKKFTCFAVGVLGIIIFALTRSLGGVWNHALMRGVFFNICLLLAIINCDLFGKITNNGFFKYAGEISFGIFLWNIPVLVWVKRFDEAFGKIIPFESFLTLLTISIITILIAAFFNKVIEKDLTKKIDIVLKNRL